MLIIMGGLPGTGKTTISKALARRLGAVHLRIDTIEEVMLADSNDALVDGGAGYRVAFAIAADNLRLGATVIADSVNPIGLTREAWRGVASRAGVPIVHVMLICSDSAEHKKRIESRPAGTRGFDWSEVQSRSIEAADREFVVIDTSHRTVEHCVEALVKVLSTESRQVP